MGRSLGMLMPERYRDRHAVKARAYSADPRPRPMGSGLDLYGLRKDGSEFPIDVSISPLPPERGRLFASTIRDVTSHRQLEQELRRRSRELEQADRQKDEFLCAVAHELRTPLAVLSLAAQILRRPQIDDQLTERTLCTLERQTAYMARLIEDLLDLARVRNGTLMLRQELVDLRTVFADAIEMAQPLVESREHHMDVSQGVEPLWVSADPTRLVQVVVNLLTNAARYTPEGGNVWLSAAKEGGVATIRIRDDGSGISRDMLSRVFELFTQADSAGGQRSGGLGVGLALVQRLVELHGGTVEATSEGPGRGSEFIVRLPLLRGAAAGADVLPMADD